MRPEAPERTALGCVAGRQERGGGPGARPVSLGAPASPWSGRRREARPGSGAAEAALPATPGPSRWRWSPDRFVGPPPAVVSSVHRLRPSPHYSP